MGLVGASPSRRVRLRSAIHRVGRVSVLDGWQAAVARLCARLRSDRHGCLVLGDLVARVEHELIVGDSGVVVIIDQDPDSACIAPLANVLFSLAFDNFCNFTVSKAFLLELRNPFGHLVRKAVQITQKIGSRK